MHWTRPAWRAVISLTALLPPLVGCSAGTTATSSTSGESPLVEVTRSAAVTAVQRTPAVPPVTGVPDGSPCWALADADDGSGQADGALGGSLPRVAAEVLAELPHDPSAYTEGLAFSAGTLYEGTGQCGESELRIVDPATGAVVQRATLPADHFGEGVTVADDRVIQLTWKNGVGHLSDPTSLAPVGEFRYAGEGWGATFDGSRVIVSDGSAVLRFLDPQTLVEIGRLRVTAQGAPVRRLNELEWVDGRIFANVWLTSDIAAIDPETGHVEQWLDVSALRPAETEGNEEAVANGIAWNPATGRLYVTGKLWDVMYEIAVPA